MLLLLQKFYNVEQVRSEETKERNFVSLITINRSVIMSFIIAVIAMVIYSCFETWQRPSLNYNMNNDFYCVFSQVPSKFVWTIVPLCFNYKL